MYIVAWRKPGYFCKRDQSPDSYHPQRRSRCCRQAYLFVKSSKNGNLKILQAFFDIYQYLCRVKINRK